MGFPKKSTFLNAINAGSLDTFHGIDATKATKHFPESEETQKGHLDQTRQGIRSTKVRVSEDEEGRNFKNNTPEKKMKDIYLRVIDLENEIHTDQTGKFPIVSSMGNKYLMVLVEIDGNAIMMEAMKNRTDGEIQKAYLTLLKRLAISGIKPKKHILDNEASKDFKKLIRLKEIEYELVPPDMHQRNKAE